MHYDCAWGLSVRKKHASILSNTWCLALIGNASAADLPTKKAASIEYVRVCTAYGAGFFIYLDLIPVSEFLVAHDLIISTKQAIPVREPAAMCRAMSA